MTGDCDRAASERRGRLVMDSASEDLLRFGGGELEGSESGRMTADEMGLRALSVFVFVYHRRV